MTVMNQSRYSCQSKTLGKYRHVKDAPSPEVPDTPQTGGNMPISPIAAGLFMVVGAVDKKLFPARLKFGDEDIF